MNDNCEFFWYEDPCCIFIMTSLSTIICIEACLGEEPFNYQWELYEFNGIDFDEADYWTDEVE